MLLIFLFYLVWVLSRVFNQGRSLWMRSQWAVASSSMWSEIFFFRRELTFDSMFVGDCNFGSSAEPVSHRHVLWYVHNLFLLTVFHRIVMFMFCSYLVHNMFLLFRRSFTCGSMSVEDSNFGSSAEPVSHRHVLWFVHFLLIICSYLPSSTRLIIVRCCIGDSRWYLL